ncbi:MAG TPA: DUF1841 family protein [Acidobacteriota bacterium]|nr:DUF1841 family protein [Acidobacteriota bacterium]
MHYDPYQDPDPEEWLELDEHERIDLVKRYHRKKRIKIPNLNVHASLHTIVETQIAMGDQTPARKTLKRLMDEGLDRHQAVHAIATTITDLLYDLRSGKKIDDPNAYCAEKLEKLTAESWLHYWDNDDTTDDA